MVILTGSAESGQTVLLLSMLAIQVNFLDKGHPIDFVQRRDARKHFLQSRLAQTGQAFGFGGATNFRAGPALDDHLANVVAEIEQFMDCRAAAITSVITGIATGVGIKDSVAMFFGTCGV